MPTFNMIHGRKQTAICAVVCLAFGLMAKSHASAADIYSQVIKPLFHEKCITCHGAVKREAGLRLDAVALIRKGSDQGSIVHRSGTSTIPLIERITATEKDHRMPPEGEGTPLKTSEIAQVTQWISQGMPGPENEEYLSGPEDHWAFRPVPLLRQLRATDPSLSIDLLVDRHHQRLGLQALPEADDMSLLRRVVFDLTGLPPSRQEIEQFELQHDPQPFEKLVEQLLSRPAHGERWARHWMDVWRYSDWDGYKDELRGSQRHIWHWRDWIVESINSNKPYDQMIREMLAADELTPDNAATLRATGFLARNFHKSNRNIWLDATVEHTSKAFLGLTIHCAKCHDHKYDPISQEDYYRFRALFEPHQVRTQAVSGQPDLMLAGIPRVFDRNPDAKTFFYVRGDEKMPDKNRTIVADVPRSLPFAFPCEIQPRDLTQDSYLPELSSVAIQNQLNSAWSKIEAARKESETLFASARKMEQNQALSAENPNPDLTLAVLILRESEASFESLKLRIQADQSKYMEPCLEASLDKAQQALDAERIARDLSAEVRLARARRALRLDRLSTEKDPKKRKTQSDKAQKELTASMQALDKLRVPNNADQLQSYTAIATELPRQSTGRRLGLANWIVDRRNPLTARVAINHLWMRHFGAPLVEDVFDFGMHVPRPPLLEVLDYLSAELIESNWDLKHIHRLIVCSKVYRRASWDSPAAFRSNVEKDPENVYLWRANVRRLDAEEIRDNLLAASGKLDSNMGGPDLSEDDGESVMRRSIYFRHAYEKQMTMMVLFDAANPTDCYRRKPSVIPQQALVLSNSELARNSSRLIESQLWKECNQSVWLYIERLFLTTLCRRPTSAEMAECLQFLQPANGDTSSLATRQSLSHVMINHNDFVSIR